MSRAKVVKNYTVVICSDKQIDKKAEELIQEGYRPWGAPSFITHNEQIKVCQAFIRKEEV